MPHSVLVVDDDPLVRDVLADMLEGLGCEVISAASPSIIPGAVDRDVFLVLDDFGRLRLSWRETDAEDPTARP